MIVVGSTVYTGRPIEDAWLRNAGAMQQASPVQLKFCLTLQYDPGYDSDLYKECAQQAERLWEQHCVPHDIDMHFELFAMGSHRWTTRHRLIGITTGRNLIREHVLRDTDATHVLFLDSDVEPDPACIPKLLELDHPVVGGDVPSYCLSGPTVHEWAPAPSDRDRFANTHGLTVFPFPVQEHWNTAGFLLVRRDVLAQVAWRWNPDDGITDDPCFAQDVERAGFGKTWVRKDCIGNHWPPMIVPVEQRGGSRTEPVF